MLARVLQQSFAYYNNPSRTTTMPRLQVNASILVGSAAFSTKKTMVSAGYGQTNFQTFYRNRSMRPNYVYVRSLWRTRDRWTSYCEVRNFGSVGVWGCHTGRQRVSNHREKCPRKSFFPCNATSSTRETTIFKGTE